MKWTEEDVAELKRLTAVVKAGYGGTLPGGMIVDRREHPEALPIPKNFVLGVPAPKPIKGEKK